MGRRKDGLKDGQTDGHMDGQTDGHMDGHCQLSRRTRGHMDGQTDGRTDSLIEVLHREAKENRMFNKHCLSTPWLFALSHVCFLACCIQAC